MTLHLYQQPGAMPYSRARFVALDVERRRLISGPDHERREQAIGPGLDGVMVGEAQEAMATNAIASERLAHPISAMRRKLDVLTLGFLPVVSQGHPALAELILGHPMAVVLDRQQPAGFSRDDHSDFGSTRISGIGHELSECNVWIVANAAQRTQHVVLFEERFVGCFASLGHGDIRQIPGCEARMTMPPAAKLGKTLELADLTRRDASETLPKRQHHGHVVNG